MSSLTPLSQFLSATSHLAAFAHVLTHPGTDVLLICVEIAIYERKPHAATELGLTIIDTRKLKSSTSVAQTVAESMQPMHFRIREYGHLVNTFRAHCNPDAFSFGMTRWITKTEGSKVLYQLLCQKIDENHPSPRAPMRPVVILGHNTRLLVRKLQEYMKVDDDSMSHIIAMIDIQNIAQDAGRCGITDISLRKVVAGIGLSPEFLSNAGNNAAATMLCAGILAEKILNPESWQERSTSQDSVSNSLDDDMDDSEVESEVLTSEEDNESGRGREYEKQYPSNNGAFFGDESSRGRDTAFKILVHTRQSELIASDPTTFPSRATCIANSELGNIALMQSRRRPVPKWGYEVYCLRCNRVNDHMTKNCDPRNKTSCRRCEAEGRPRHIVISHHTLRCLRTRNQAIEKAEE